MIAIICGQIGLRKKIYLSKLVKYAEDNSKRLRVFNVGDMMYKCDPTIRPGQILDKKCQN